MDNIFEQIAVEEKKGKKNMRLQVKDKKYTLSLFAELIKKEYNPSFFEDVEGNAYIEITLKSIPQFRESKVIHFKIEDRILSVEDNIIKVNFGI